MIAAVLLVISQLAINEARAKKKNMLYRVQTPRSLVFLYRPTDGEEQRTVDIVAMAPLDDLSKPPVKKRRVKVTFANDANEATKMIDK